MPHHHDKEHSCSCESSSSVRQTLEEMDFERGIWYAAQQNDLERVDFLLRKGTSVNKEDLAGYSALHYAARNGHLSVCKTLLAHGASIDARTRSGQATALHRAASQGHVEVVNLLLKAGADPNIKDADGFTALHRAISADSFAACQVLMARTDLGIKDNQLRTPLQLTIHCGNDKLIHLFADT